jgi:hypothetical protein
VLKPETNRVKKYTKAPNISQERVSLVIEPPVSTKIGILKENTRERTPEMIEIEIQMHQI